MSTTDTIAESVREWFARYQPLAHGALLVVGVSGGPDSVCLLHVLCRLRDQLGIILHVAHLDHRLRGAESEADAAYVIDLARHWQIPATVEAVDVAAYAQEQRENLHQAARVVRYRFLARVAQHLGAAGVVVAHHANDQAETVLLHLLRGAGTGGLGGMLPVAELHFTPGTETESSLPACRVLRPLLEVSRAQIEQYCAAHQLQPRQDATNQDQQWLRNRIRHTLIPQLIGYNPRIIEALGQTAAICRDDHAFIEQALDAAWPDLVQIQQTGVMFHGAAWRGLHPALQRAALRRGFRQVSDADLPTWEQIEQARALVRRGVGKRIDLPGAVMLTVGYAGGFTLGTPAPDDGPQLAMQPIILSVPDRIELAHGWTIESHEVTQIPPSRGRWEAYFDADRLTEPLLLRPRQAGDRLRLGAHQGHRRVQDLFVDAKVPRSLREHWPLLLAGTQIAWVPGVRADTSLQATTNTERIIRIQIVPPHVDEVLQSDE